VLSKTLDPTAMAGARQNTLVWTKAPRSYPEVDQTSLWAGKPDQTGSSIRSAWWVVRIYETCICNVLGLGATSSIRIANEWWTLVVKMRGGAFVEP
jgi:hypothetical protein